MPTRNRFLLHLFLSLTLSFAAGRGWADPTWWNGNAKEAQKAAKQSNRWMILYFETEKSESCLRMRDQTWPFLLAAEADKNFVWLRLNPKEHQEFYQFFQVFQTPELVVTDGDSNERARLRGYIKPEILKTSLANVYTQTEQKEKMVLLPDGRTMSQADYDKSLAENRKAFEGKGYFWYESFDSYGSFERLDFKRYNFQIQASSDLDAGGGRFGSPGLYVGSDIKTYRKSVINPSAVVHIDLSTGSDGKKLSDVDLVEGRIEVRLMMKARSMPDQLAECAQLVIMPKGGGQASAGSKRFSTTLAKTDTAWAQRIIVSDPVRLKEVRPVLTLWLNNTNDGFFVDDISVRLLAPTGEAGADDPGMLDPTKALIGLNPGEKLDSMFKGFDKDNDRRITKREAEFLEGGLNTLETLVIHMPFDKADANRDGYLSYEEFKAAKDRKK